MVFLVAGWYHDLAIRRLGGFSCEEKLGRFCEGAIYLRLARGFVLVLHHVCGYFYILVTLHSF